MKKAACGEREILHPAASTQLVRCPVINNVREAVGEEHEAQNGVPVLVDHVDYGVHL
jgi:hypothetical protein